MSMSTKDPSTAHRRIWVGNLNPGINQHDLGRYFDHFGSVVGVSIFRGYGFVQFKTEEEANKAIDDGASRLLKGFQLVVRSAVKGARTPKQDDRLPKQEDRPQKEDDGRPPKEDDRPPKNDDRPRKDDDRSRKEDDRARKDDDGPPKDDRPPKEDSRPPREDSPPGRPGPWGRDRGSRWGGHDRMLPPFRENGGRGGRGGRGGHDRMLPPFHEDGPPDRKRPRGPRDARDWSPPPGRGPPRRPPFDYDEEENGYERYPRFRGGPPGYDEGRPGGPPGLPPPYAQRPRPAAAEEERANDCEIVVLDRKNRPYAEEVEDRLKNVGLAVDMLFPREGAPINQVLDQIVSRGTLYAVVVHPTNEQHRSVSLNIMHGNPPQEHRNMPLDDAMSLVARNFEAYILSNSDKAPPQGIINLLTFVRENRPLTAVEYSRLIRYLEEKRDHQLKPDKSSLGSLTSSLSSIAPKPVPAPLPTAPVATASQQQIDLQQKILSMMQAYKTQPAGAAVGGAVPAPVAAPVPAPVLPPAGPPPGSLTRVSSAIDSLVTSGSNLLKMEESSQQQQYGARYGYSTQPPSSLGQAPANPLFGAYANQGY